MLLRAGFIFTSHFDLPGVPTTKKKNHHPKREVRQHIVHLFVVDDVVRTRTHYLPERKAPESYSPTFSCVKNDKPRPRYKSEKTKDFLGLGNRVFGQMGLATTGRSAGNSVLPERRSLLRKVSTIAQASLETPKCDYILSGFPTMQASCVGSSAQRAARSWLSDVLRGSETAAPRR